MRWGMRCLDASPQRNRRRVHWMRGRGFVGVAVMAGAGEAGSQAGMYRLVTGGASSREPPIEMRVCQYKTRLRGLRRLAPPDGNGNPATVLGPPAHPLWSTKDQWVLSR